MTTEHDLYAARERELNAAVGDVVSRWARLEFTLLMIFGAALRIPLPTAIALMSHVKTFTLTLDLTNTAVQCAMAERQELKFWNSLVEYVRELSGDRNYLAHTSVVIHGPGADDGPNFASAIPKVGPAMIAFGSLARFGAIDAAEASELVHDIQEAPERLFEFNRLLAGSETFQQKFNEPIVRRRPARKQRLEAAKKAPKCPPRSSQA